MPIAHWTAPAAQISYLHQQALHALRSAVRDALTGETPLGPESDAYRSTLVARLSILRQSIAHWTLSKDDHQKWIDRQRRVGRRPLGHVWARMQRDHREETIHQLEVVTAQIAAYHGWIQHRLAGGQLSLESWMNPPVAPPTPRRARAS